jgi:hypothetical protein
VQPAVFLISVGSAPWNADLAKYFWTANFILFLFRLKDDSSAGRRAET